MKIFSLTVFLFFTSILSFAQKQIEPGLTDLEPEGIVNIITDIAISPNNNTLCLTGSAGRTYLFDVSVKGKTKMIWKNTDIKGMPMGSTANFSKDGKYIAIKGFRTTTAKVRSVLFSTLKKAWQNTDDVCVLDAKTGNEIIHHTNAYAISISGNMAFVSDNDGFIYYDLTTGKETKRISIEENENAVISPNGKYIIESWDADKQAMKQVASVERRRNELKNAYRAKKLLVIYDANNLNKPFAISNDEVDVVTDIQFDDEEKNFYVQMQLAGEEHSNNPNANVFQKINLQTGEIDKTFGIKGNYCKLNTKTGKVSSLFAGGIIGMKKQIRIQDPSNTEDYAMFETRYKLFKTSTMLTPVAMATNSNIAYVYYEKQLFEWDYSIVKKYFKKSAGASEEELIQKVDSILDKTLENPNSKLSKDIKKIGITGDYIMDITVTGPKGNVQTVFCESDEHTNIEMQNALKDLIRKQEFEIGLPKDRRIKFRYTFQL